MSDEADDEPDWVTRRRRRIERLLGVQMLVLCAGILVLVHQALVRHVWAALAVFTTAFCATEALATGDLRGDLSETDESFLIVAITVLLLSGLVLVT